MIESRLPAWHAIFRRNLSRAWIFPLIVPLLVMPAAGQQDAFQAKLDAAASALDRYPRFKGL
ncbi:MAG: hypothetical protein JO228_02135, partial [Xanthobacteraceae bacterium]|nr:hypothetical protein [Xanthobacteraceae bacterium]